MRIWRLPGLLEAPDLRIPSSGTWMEKPKRFREKDERSALAKNHQKHLLTLLCFFSDFSGIFNKKPSRVLRRQLDWRSLCRSARSSQYNPSSGLRSVGFVCVLSSLRVRVSLPCDVFLGQVWQLRVRGASRSDGSSLFILRKTSLLVESEWGLIPNSVVLFRFFPLDFCCFSWLSDDRMLPSCEDF